MKPGYRKRRLFVAIITAIIAIILIACHPSQQQPTVSPPATPSATISQASGDAVDALNKIEVKGRAPKTGYSRDQFGEGWGTEQGCDTRNAILRRDLTNVVVDEKCRVMSGTLNDPYTGKVIAFTRGQTTSDDVQIDHVIALSDAWQTGAQQLTREQRMQLANDPLELLAVEGAANQQKSDSNAASWLPANKDFRCQYVARQIAVKAKYQLWVIEAERNAMLQVLSACPGQKLPTP